MLCERILFNLDQRSANFAAERGLDAVEFHWSELSRRAIRKRARSGTEVRILLPLGNRLRHGDVIGEEPGRLIAVEVMALEVWVARPGDAATLAKISLELGNLHIAAEVSEAGEVIVCPDGPAAAIFTRYALTWETRVMRFAPLRCEGLIVKASADFKVQTSAAPATSAYEQSGI